MAKEKEQNSAVLTSEELSVFCDQIALMLESGMTLRDGIDMLAEDEEKQGARVRPYSLMRETIEETGSLYIAMKEREDEWPHYMIEMVGIGEETGRLEDIMHNLSAYYLREGKIKDAASSAVTYPLVLGVMMVVIIAVLLWRVMPVFRRVLGSLGVNPDGASMRLMNIGSIAGWIVLAIIAVMIIAVVSVAVLMRTKHRDKVLARLRNLLPPVQRISQKLSSSRIAGMLGMMLSGGFPIENAIDMAANALDDEQSIAKVKEIKGMMDQGEPFADAITASGLFSDFYNRILKIGAASGHEPQVMTRIAEVYEEQVEDDLSRLISLIEPVLVALLSIVIGAILLSMMLPMAGVMSSL
ncbi:MAG: type II secretion system F family protein [Clostridia bacterium]|nr:type II secretion system F family protein [Clostridia bacterium]